MTKEKLGKIKKFLRENANAIQKLATAHHKEFLGGLAYRNEFIEKYQENHIKIVNEFANYLDVRDIKSGIKIFKDLGEKLAKDSVKDNLTLEDAIDGTLFLKQAVWQMLEEQGLLSLLSTDEFYFISQRIGTYCDIVASKIAFSYHHFYILQINEEKKRQEEAEQRISNILENIPDGFVSYDRDFRYVYVNEKAAQMARMKKEEIIGKTIFEIFPVFVGTHAFQEYQRIMREGKPGQVEYFSPRVQRWVRVHLYPSKQGMANFIVDIAERKQTEAHQEFLEKVSTILGMSIDYKTTLNNIAKLIIPYLADYCRIVLVDENKRIQEIAVNHVDPKKISLVKKLYKLYKEEKSVKVGVWKIIETGKSELVSKITPERYKGLNPEILHIVKELNVHSHMGVPMAIGDKIVGALSLTSTRKDRKYTKEDLVFAEELARRSAFAVENARLYEKAKIALALRDEFISVASHELKTPVTSLKIYAQSLQKQLERRGEKTYIDLLVKMVAQVDKLTMLINDLLNVSRVQFGRLEFHKKAFDLNDLVREIVDSIQPTTRKHKIIIEGVIKRQVVGDRDRIGQVLTNLLTNAIKYSIRTNMIKVQLSSEKDVAVVTVQDFGIGIEKQHLAKLFNRFYRVTDGQERTFPGLGIGLYISNEIIKRHHGTMSVVSNKRRGSQFSFTLPYKGK